MGRQIVAAANGGAGYVSQDTMRSSWHHPSVKQFLWFCLPALLLGFVLRAALTWQMPYGYMQFDTADFLSTAASFLAKGHLSIHPKRTFLVPVLYTLPFVLKLPALILIPIAQHFLGLGVVLMSGALVRLWLRTWKWVIVPLTLIIAANPVLLWYEHTLMSESVYLFCVFALALTATFFTQQPTGRHFAGMLVALFFTAAARPEGRIFLGFGFLLLVLMHWRSWKTLWRRLAWWAGAVVVTLLLTPTHQAGQLLYATVLPLAPDESKVDPEFGRLMRPLRDEVRIQHGDVPQKLQSLEQKLADAADGYLKGKGVHNPDGNSLCQKMAIEACLNRPWAVPDLAFRKFLLASKGPTSVGYDEPRLHEKLNVGFNRKEQLTVLSNGLVGQQLSDETAVADFVRDHYHPLRWYRSLDEGWQWLTMNGRGDRIGAGAARIPGLPAFFKLALAAMVIALLMPGTLQRFHFAWILSLGLLWFAVSLTGVDNPRYRFVFEPFCLIYIAVGAALLCETAMRLITTRRGDAGHGNMTPSAVAPESIQG